MLFKFFKIQPSALPPKAEGTITKRIASYCLKIQRISADWMQMKTEQLSVKSKVILLLLFMILTSAFNFILLSICFTNAKPLSFWVTPIESPVYIGKANNTPGDSTSVFSGEFQILKDFKKQIDRLSKTQSVRKPYHSFTALHPQLIDSLLFIEKIYHSTHKK